MNIRDATRSYEAWLRQETDVVNADLRLKHAEMRKSPFRFLRATFYRWLEVWPTVCARAARAPRVLAIGDLHVENFGTWRDVEGRLVWGVNDLDEVCELPYTQDLIRLATSAVLAVRKGHFRIDPREGCRAILEGYVRGLELGGRPFVLAEQRRWLYAIVLSESQDPVRFWKNLSALPKATGRVPRATLRAALPDRRLPYTVVRRVAGLGSLGRQRFVALATWGRARIAREAKAYVPPAAVRTSFTASSAGAVLARAARVPDPFYRFDGAWVVRRLAPDCTKIELSDLPATRDEVRLLRAMGMEVANMHMPRAKVALAHLRAAPKRWLERSAMDMADVVSEDWQHWRDAT